MTDRVGVRPAELAIAGLVIGVVAMLIVPLPTPLLDGLLTLNIGIGVALLMAAVFSPRPASFTSFPVLLVVTTLFRVGLEVSTTRLILADADAGSVVHAFGSSVVAESLVVGVVVFAVITIVQLIVVSRGAERVAEVSARFALDAMPGKQMAIDAEQRTGVIDAEAARRRRGELERESQLYGAMDGAMRFVKGDAIAAIVIVAINLIGGLAIGIGSRGMTAAEAIRTYSLLSIGSGLVAQIPSLLVAVASGLLVTRVASAGDRRIGDDLGIQLGGQPHALTAAAGLLIGLGLVPGLPLLPFAVLGMIAGSLALIAARRRPPVVASLDEPSADAVRGSRLSLRVSGPLYSAFAARLDELHAVTAAARATIEARTGIPIPAFAIQRDRELADRETALAIDGTPIVWLRIDDHSAHGDKLTDALATAVPELISIDRVASLIERTASTSPVRGREVVPRVVSQPVLTEVVRGLVREQVPVHD
ncbi:MAG: FHIPEP family type III secretion protein, partial [Kofleriaceae bacterium]